MLKIIRTGVSLLLCISALNINAKIGLLQQGTMTNVEAPLAVNSAHLSESLFTANNNASICNAIRNYLLNKKGAVILSAKAKADLVKAAPWPTAYCSVEGSIYSACYGKNVKVYAVSPGVYRYSCSCPYHGDKYRDDCDIYAKMRNDGKVIISRIICKY